MTSLPLRQKRALDDVNLESEPETKPHKLDFNNESTKIAFGFGLGVGTIVTMVIGLVLLSLYFCVKRFSSNRLVLLIFVLCMSCSNTYIFMTSHLLLSIRTYIYSIL